MKHQSGRPPAFATPSACAAPAREVRGERTPDTSGGKIYRGSRQCRKRSAYRTCSREGEYWTIVYAGQVVRVRDTKGLRYMARLLAQPGQRLRAVDLVDGPEAADADPAAAERARVNVPRAIKAARERIAANTPDLGRHLETTLHTGVRCAYVPDARVPIYWSL